MQTLCIILVSWMICYELNVIVLNMFNRRDSGIKVIKKLNVYFAPIFFLLTVVLIIYIIGRTIVEEVFHV